MEVQKLIAVLKKIAHDEKVQSEVWKNFYNNLWWPSDVNDKKLRLIIAGLSTRISYSMIESYRKVIDAIVNLGYYNLSNLPENKIIEIIKPLGLSNTRLKYIKSMINFIEKNKNLDQLKDEEFIKKINIEVNGASYKVAQCCLLYYKGYPCSIMPVDSGMKDVLLPCIGYDKQKQGVGHEIARLLLEEDVNSIDKKEFIKNNGLNINEEEFNWWAHLSLIYYKRQHCNKKDAECPLHEIKNYEIREECLGR